jgi:hypothetical protein
LGWISTTTTSQDEPGRALTAALQNTAVGLWCSCMCSAHALLVRARSCVSVYPSLNEYVPIYSICDAFQAPRISHLSALISHLAALISHLASLSSHLAPRISQLSSRTSLSLRWHAKSLDDGGGGARCAARNIEIASAPPLSSAPLPHRLPSGHVLCPLECWDGRVGVWACGRVGATGQDAGTR